MFEGFHGKVDGTDLGSAPVLALFHMDGCPHCVKFMPTWEKFKQQHGDKVKTVELEAKKDEGVVSKNDTRKTRLSLRQINKARRAGEFHKEEQQKELHFVRQMYGLASQPEA